MEIPIRVMVVEDSPEDQELLHRQLRKTAVGNHVLFFSDPRAALEWLQDWEGRQDLIAIFLDVHLPYMSGIDVLKVIRSMDGMESFPIMVMTSSPHPETVAACEQLKVNAFVEKPVTFQDFSKVIAPLFHQTRAESVLS